MAISWYPEPNLSHDYKTNQQILITEALGWILHCLPGNNNVHMLMPIFLTRNFLGWKIHDTFSIHSIFHSEREQNSELDDSDEIRFLSGGAKVHG